MKKLLIVLVLVLLVGCSSSKESAERTTSTTTTAPKKYSVDDEKKYLDSILPGLDTQEAGFVEQYRGVEEAKNEAGEICPGFKFASNISPIKVSGYAAYSKDESGLFAKSDAIIYMIDSFENDKAAKKYFDAAKENIQNCLGQKKEWSEEWTYETQYAASGKISNVDDYVGYIDNFESVEQDTDSMYGVRILLGRYVVDVSSPDMENSVKELETILDKF